MVDSPLKPKKGTQHLRRSFILAVSLAALLWLIKLVDVIFGFDLVQYGVYPRRLSGLIGIVWAPLIHGSMSHVFANTTPIIILGTALLYGYPKLAIFVIPAIYSGSGLGVWLFARSAYHIGSSGLIFGMMFFVFTIGVLRWDRLAITLSLLVFLLYGGMIWGIFPGTPGVSFESHFFGAMTGIALAILLKPRFLS
ncbi:MAG: rhomboid family intramembrane serine protease [Pseudomonadota bacterium]